MWLNCQPLEGNSIFVNTTCRVQRLIFFFDWKTSLRKRLPARCHRHQQVVPSHKRVLRFWAPYRSAALSHQLQAHRQLHPSTILHCRNKVTEHQLCIKIQWFSMVWILETSVLLPVGFGWSDPGGIDDRNFRNFPQLLQESYQSMLIPGG